MAYLLRLESDLWKWNHISLVPLFLQKRLKLLLYFWMFQNVNVNVNVSYIFSIDVSGLHFLICFIQNFWNKIIKSLYMMVVFLPLLYPVICTHGYICIQDYLIIYLMFFSWEWTISQKQLCSTCYLKDWDRHPKIYYWKTQL